MTTKDQALIAEPWDVWPDGVIPAEGNRPQLHLRTPEEGRKWLAELAESRRKCRLPDGTSSLAVIRRERDEH